MAEMGRTFREGNLHEMVELLANPARSGLYLTKSRIRRIGGDMGLRAGVQSRVRMLENLFREAGSEDRVEELLGRLDAEAAAWLERYRGWSRACPPARAAWRDWAKKAKELRRHLARAQKWVRRLRAEASSSRG